MKINIELHGRVNGRNAMVVGYAQADAADHALLLAHRWYRGGRHGKYAVTFIEGRTVLMHRLLLAAHHRRVTHLDHDPLNNTRANLSLL